MYDMDAVDNFCLLLFLYDCIYSLNFLYLQSDSFIMVTMYFEIYDRVKEG